jgi:hypothetical protein
LSQSGLTARELAVAQHWTAAADMKVAYYPIVRQSNGLSGDFTYIYVLECLPRETETAKKAGTSEKDGVLSKNPGFLNFLIFHGALSHKVLPLMLENQQCSYQDAASV